MTPLSPLQLKQYFFTLFSVRPNQQGTPQAQPVLEQTISFEKTPKEQNQWTLSLRILMKSAKPEAPALYEGEIEMVGVVEVGNGYPPEKAQQLAVVNGLSLLYSAIREMFLTFTARCAHGPMTLPVLSFVDVLAGQAITPAPAPTEAPPATEFTPPTSPVPAPAAQTQQTGPTPAPK
jgi:preprotein translocase subunit SecB